MNAKDRRAETDQSDEPSGELKSRKVAFRTVDRIYGLLQKSAAERGRTLSEETERRIERSFADDDLLKALAFGSGSNTPDLMRIILTAVGSIEGGTWDTRPEVARELFYVLDSLLHMLLVRGAVPVQEK